MLFYNEIKHFLGQYFAHNMLDKAVDTVTGAAAAKAADVMKAKIFGIGSNDEFLTFDAAAIAHAELGVSIRKIAKVFGYLSTLTREERNKATNILGKMDNQVIIVEEKTPGKGQAPPQNKGKQSSPRVETKNMRGAKMIKLLSEMNESQLENFLKGCGVLDTTSSNIAEMWETAGKALEEIEKETGLVSFFNSLARDANKKIKENKNNPKKRKFATLKKWLY